MNKNLVFINGEFIDHNKASLLISDLSFQRGYAVFDYFKTINHKPVFLDDHLDRFYFSASEMFMKPPYNRVQLKKIINELILKNGLKNSGVRITLTGGYSEDGYSIGSPNLVIKQSLFNYNVEEFERGISLITYDHLRQLPHIKTTDYVFAIYLQRFLREQQADEVVYHHDSEISECPRANFFIVTKNNEVITPAKNVLKGITRKKILEFIPVKVNEGTITIKDVVNAKEVFITSTTKYVLPVVKINGQKIGDGIPGEITREISSLLIKLF